MLLRTKFLNKVKRKRGCWEWLGSKINGYGQFYYEGKNYRAHRLSYKIFIGPTPDDLFVCHKCDNPGCVNPKHLFLGTNSDNQKDCVAKGRHKYAARTHCNKGHEFTPENTMPRKHKTGSYRGCRICDSERKKKKWKTRTKEQIERRRLRNRLNWRKHHSKGAAP